MALASCVTLGKPLNLSASLLEQAHHKAAFVLTFCDCALGEAEGESRRILFYVNNKVDPIPLVAKF